MFNLKTSVSELTSLNNGMAKAQFEQIATSRDVTGNNFPNSSIHYSNVKLLFKLAVAIQKYLGIQIHEEESLTEIMDRFHVSHKSQT